jgi:sugar lactone lactonase YvrE
VIASRRLTSVSFVAIDFTDQGQTGLQDQTGGVWCYTAAGRLHQLISNGISPNGIVLSPDEKSLYVAMYVSPPWKLPANAKVDTF